MVDAEYQVADNIFKENIPVLKEDFVVCRIKKKMDKEKNVDHVMEAQDGDVEGIIMITIAIFHLQGIFSVTRSVVLVSLLNANSSIDHCFFSLLGGFFGSREMSIIVYLASVDYVRPYLYKLVNIESIMKLTSSSRLCPTRK